MSLDPKAQIILRGAGQTKVIGSTNGKGGPDEEEPIKSNVTNDVHQTEALSYSFQIIKNDTKNSYEIKSFPKDYDPVISATYGLPLIKNDNKKLNNNTPIINKQPLIYSNQNNKPSDIQTLDISSSSSSESSYISNTLLDLLFDLDIQGNMASI